MSQYKICTLCRIRKPIDSFHKDITKPDGMTTRCSSCRNILANAYRIDKAEGTWVSKRRPKLSKVAIRKKRNAYARKINVYRVFRNATARARKFNARIGTFSKSEIKALYRSNCFYCNSPERISIDHVIPLAKGGSHTIGNLVACCGSCNASKKNKFFYEWKMSLGSD